MGAGAEWYRRRQLRLLLAVGLLGLTLAAGFSRPAEAGLPPAEEPEATPALLEDAVARGEIDQRTADRHLVEVFAGKGKSGKVPARFQSDVAWDGTIPLAQLRARVAAWQEGPARSQAVEALTAVSNCPNAGVASPGRLPNEATTAHFYVSYGTIGGGLTINDYVSTLEAAYAKEVTQFGWAPPPTLQPPPPPPIGTRYPVRVEELSGLLGYVSYDEAGTGAGLARDNPSTPWNEEDARASCMVLRRDFGGFRTPPLRLLEAAVAHEFNHAIQYGYGAFGPDAALLEAATTLMEDEVFDDSNDNYNYLWPDFRDSLGDYDRTGPLAGYDQWIVLRGLTERFGTGVPGGVEQVMQDFWETISQNENRGQNRIEPLAALALALEKKGVTLPDAYHDFAIAAGFMRPCGGGYSHPHCFEEAAGYVARAGLPPVAGSAVGGSFSSSIEDDYSLAWVTLPSSSSYSVTLENTSTGGQLRATAVCDTGSALLRAPLPAVVGAGMSTTLTNFSPTSCVRRLAVITNQQQSPTDPSASPLRTFTLRTGAAGPNQPPVGRNDTYTAFAGTPLNVGPAGVLANDTDPNANSLTASLTTTQAGGTVNLNPNGSFTFTPAPGFTGTTGFSYTANDGNGGTASASVTITVSPGPPPATGYRLVASDGGIFGFGDARFHGSTGGVALDRPIVGMAATPSGDGYWLVASDGGIFSFGDAGFFGSTGGVALTRPIVGMETTPSGRGYWLVASDGGIFSFGDAGFFGSTGGVALTRPIVGMAATPSGRGYWLVASDGGIFSFGDAGFFGSTGGVALSRPIEGMAATPSGRGYWLVASDGGIFSFGDANFFGSTGGITLDRPIVGMAART